MNRIASRFLQLAHKGRKGFIPFVTAGDPDQDTSLEIVLKLAELGADVIELGVPFSDPMADGPTIQRSSQRALAGGVTLDTVLDLVRNARLRSDVPIVLFSYLNPLLRYGIDRLADSAAEAGVDGILITDIVDEDADELSLIFHKAEIDMISLIAPTTTDRRLEKIARSTKGFLYAVSRAGVTGARSEVSEDAEKLVARARAFTDLPIAVGFGISTKEQLSEVWKYADAAVVGSAIVTEIEEHQAEAAVIAVAEFVKGLVPRFAESGAEP